jgi:hypothetical protein
MMQSQRQEKICLGCEGTISAHTLFCPYCGSDVKAQEEYSSEEQKSSSSLQSLQEMSNLSSLYKPPYTPNQKGFGVPSYTDSYRDASSSYEEPSYEESTHCSEPRYAHEEKKAKVEVGLWPLLFLSVGMNLLTIGLLLFFFSDRGKLILEWNSYYWFVYCIIATPLLMFGWRLLNSSDQQSD